MKHLAKLYLSIFLLLSFSACEESVPSIIEEPDTQEEQIGLFLDNAIDFGIAPLITQLENESAQLESALAGIENTTGQIELAPAREAWLAMSKLLIRMEVLDVDQELDKSRILANNRSINKVSIHYCSSCKVFFNPFQSGTSIIR
ncbi:MAG: hypothetical protein AAGD28_16830 [Bacteroidota bacterium]